MRPPKATRVPVARRARRRAACGSPRTRRRGCARTRSRRASVSASDATNGSYEPSSGRARVGHDDARGGRGSGRERGVAEARADLGERLVDERLEALARLDGEAARRRSWRRRGCSRCGYLLGECEQAVGAAHGQAVGEQRVDDVPIVAAVRRAARPRARARARRGAGGASPRSGSGGAAGRTCGPRDGHARRAGSARSAGRARGRPARRGRRAPGSTPTRARRGGAHVGRAERALEHAAHVRVERRHLGAEREARDRARGVRADPGQPLEALRCRAGTRRARRRAARRSGG